MRRWCSDCGIDIAEGEGDPRFGGIYHLDCQAAQIRFRAEVEQQRQRTQEIEAARTHQRRERRECRIQAAIAAGISMADIESMLELERRTQIPLCLICGQDAIDGYCACDLEDES